MAESLPNQVEDQAEDSDEKRQGIGLHLAGLPESNQPAGIVGGPCDSIDSDSDNARPFKPSAESSDESLLDVRHISVVELVNPIASLQERIGYGQGGEEILRRQPLQPVDES